MRTSLFPFLFISCSSGNMRYLADKEKARNELRYHERRQRIFTTGVAGVVAAELVLLVL